MLVQTVNREFLNILKSGLESFQREPPDILLMLIQTVRPKVPDKYTIRFCEKIYKKNYQQNIYEKFFVPATSLVMTFIYRPWKITKFD